MDNQKHKKIIIFEEISPRGKRIISRYISGEYEIRYIRLNRASKDKKWVKDFIKRGHLKKINPGLNLYTVDGLCYDLAFVNIDNFYRSIKDNRMLEKIIKLYDNDNISLMFKKRFIEKLVRFYYLNYTLNWLQNRYADKMIMFVPAFSIDFPFYETDNCEIYDYRKLYKLAKDTGADRRDTSRIKFPIWATLLSYFNTCDRKRKIFLQFVGFFFWVCLIRVRDFIKYSNGSKSNYKYAIMVISPLRQFSNKIQKVDFLIDGQTIKKEDVIFLSCNKLRKKSKNYMEDNGLNYLDDVDRFVSEGDIKKILPVYFSLLGSFLKENSLILDMGLRAMFFYLRWNGFAKNMEIKNLITHGDFGTQSIARNIILEAHNCKTYYYMDTTNFGFYLEKNDQKYKYRHSLFSFLYYDYFISWNDIVPKIFKSAHANIKNYINLGCFWAEHLKLIEEGKIASDFKDRLYNRWYRDGMKIISVFDSGLDENSIANYEDGIRFLEGALKLLDDLPNIFVVSKEKQPRNRHKKVSSRYKEILKLYDRIEKNERCYCLNYDLENPWESSSEIIAFSDLVISFPFTSTTVEALAARKKGVWYDATDKFRDTFYAKIPDLVCHDYEELLSRVKKLLFETTDEEYNEYLDKNIKGKVENYLDGKAISRFRGLLTQDSVKSKEIWDKKWK